jgi:site-specific DNA recombinase
MAEYRRELDRLNSGRKCQRLDRIDRQIRAIVEAIRDGMRTPAMREDLLALETIDAAPAEAPALHPELAAVYQQKVANIQEELNRPQLRTEAAEAIRSLIDEITLTSENGRREIA